MSKIQIEALEPIKSDGYDLEMADRLSVPDEVGQRWIAAGWAKDVAGNIPTGERKVMRATVTPHPATLAQSAETVSNG